MENSSATRFGYLVPEFPGQTHSFFWREITALRSAGLQPDLVSTRPPHPGTASHGWCEEAAASTYYLTSPDPRQVTAALTRFLLTVCRHPGMFTSLVRIAVQTAAEKRHSGGGRAKALADQAGLIVAGVLLSQHALERGWRLVHVHSCGNAAQVALYAHLSTGLRYSLTLHGGLADYGPNQAAKWRHASFATVITSRLHEQVTAELPDLPAQVVVSSMGVDTDAFHRTSRYEAWSPGKVARIFSCGRLNAAKGHDILIRAMAVLRRTGVDARLAIAGEDDVGGTSPYRALLESIIAEEGLADCVTLLGAVPEIRVRSELESSHVFVLASHAEPLGVAVMEAMSLELPTVTTRAGGVVELVEDGRTGLLVPPADADALAAALGAVLADPRGAKDYGVAGRARAVARFDCRITARALEALIRSACQEAP